MRLKLFRSALEHRVHDAETPDIDALLDECVKIGGVPAPESPDWIPLESGEGWGWIHDAEGEKIHPLIEGAKVLFERGRLWIDHPLTDCYVMRRSDPAPFELGGRAGEILEIYRRIALPYHKGIFEAKARAIEAVASGSGRVTERRPDVGVVVRSPKPPRLVVVTHMDLIRKFNAGFWAGRGLRLKNGWIVGALDNTVTNAVALHLLLDGRIPDDVEVVFTNDEESGSGAAYAYASGSPETAGFINLDVSFPSSAAAIVEYDRPNADTLWALTRLFADGGVNFTCERWPDDLCSIHRAGRNGLSFTLPTKKEIHSWGNRTTPRQLAGYAEALERLLRCDANLSAKQDLATFKPADLKSRKSLEKRREKFKKRKGPSLFEDDFGEGETVEIDADDVIGFLERRTSRSLSGSVSAWEAAEVFADWACTVDRYVSSGVFIDYSVEFNSALAEAIQNGDVDLLCSPYGEDTIDAASFK